MVSGCLGGRLGQCGEHFGHVGVDHLVAVHLREGHMVMPVVDEVPVTDPKDLNWGHRLAVSLREREQYPSLSDPVGGGTKAAVEVAALVHRADDAGQPNALHAERSF